MQQEVGSQWIVAARPLCHLQCPVAYLSRLQRIQPTDRLEFQSKADPRDEYTMGAIAFDMCPWGAETLLLWGGKQSVRACAASLAWILT